MIPKATAPVRQNAGGKNQVPKIPPPPKANGSAGGIRSVSLKNLAQKFQQHVVAEPQVNQQKTEAPIDPNWKDAFNQEQLDTAWRSYTRQHESSPRLHTIYKNHPPRQVQDASLRITLLNKTQEHELNKERASILSYLRRSLRNAAIQLDLEISQDEGTQTKRAYTVADKYKEMAEKNPALVAFRKQFNLDFE